MRFTAFMSQLLGNASRDGNGNYLLRDPCMTDSAGYRLNVEELALFSAIDLLAAIGSTCEWMTYRKNQRTKSDDWYSFNIEPNRNQNAAEFKRLLIARLLRFGEALVFVHNGQYLLADSFHRSVRAYYPNQYSSVTCNNLTLDKTFSEDEVFYFRLADQQAAALIARLDGLYSQALTEALDKYKRSGGRSGVVEISAKAAGSPNYEKKLDDLMNNRFKRYFENKNAVLPLNEGFRFIPHDGPAAHKSVSEVSDMESIFRQAQDRSCNAIHVAPGLLRGDVTGLDDAINYTLTFGLMPILKIIQTEINRKCYGRQMLEGWGMRIDATHAKTVDIFAVAEKAEKLLQNRLYNVNSLREKLNDELLPFDWAEDYVMTKNAEVVTTSGGA